MAQQTTLPNKRSIGEILEGSISPAARHGGHDGGTGHKSRASRRSSRERLSDDEANIVLFVHM
jgi:hypothetical protein